MRASGVGQLGAPSPRRLVDIQVVVGVCHGAPGKRVPVIDDVRSQSGIG